MVITFRLPTWRALALVLVGALFVAPIAGRMLGMEPTGGSVSAATQTRATSCAGLDFHPLDNYTYYANVGPLLIKSANSTGASNFFVCDPGLPHNAVVTKVQFTLRDDWTFAEVRNCALVRNGLTAATAEPLQVMGSVPTTGADAQPGTVRRTDTSIDFATVDNTKWGYWLQCEIDGDARDEVGIYGADVVYTITSASG